MEGLWIYAPILAAIALGVCFANRKRKLLALSPSHVRVLAGGLGMMNSAQQEWMKLCDQVIHEQDPERFFQLIVDINNMLWVKQNRLIAQRAKKLKVN